MSASITLFLSENTPVFTSVFLGLAGLSLFFTYFTFIFAVIDCRDMEDFLIGFLENEINFYLQMGGIAFLEVLS